MSQEASVTPTDTRVALVTGANRGLGLETSRQLLAQGLRVVLTGRDNDALDRAAATLDPSADRVMPVRMDVGDVDSITAAGGRRAAFRARRRRGEQCRCVDRRTR
jgi:NAD(P)-dependent dehydrogenase (short-subunit alcohol dehydrogenase family)